MPSSATSLHAHASSPPVSMLMLRPALTAPTITAPRFSLILFKPIMCSSETPLSSPLSSPSPFTHTLPSTSLALSKDGAANLQTNCSAQPLSAPSMLVFSGGTAFNGVVEELKKFTTSVTHVLPVSDDGGSTAEIVRVLGGPAVGDIRSRCLRLSDESTLEAVAVKRLLGHRLQLDAIQAKAEWYEIVEGEHSLWQDVSGPYRETIRAFLVYFQTQILSCSHEKFCFSNGSIGNFFFAGARLFFQSLDAAIFLFSRVSQIPTDSFVLPAICTNDRLTLGCELQDGTVIRGQNEISHPFSLESSARLPQFVTKVMHSSSRLSAPIKRIFYMSSDGTNLLHEVFPAVNATVVEHLNQVYAITYGMGSLFTSICPSLVLRGVGEVIAKRTCPKILVLNGSHDRETFGMLASDFIASICNALNRRHGDPQKCLEYPPTSYVNIILVPRMGHILVDKDNLAAMGMEKVVTVDSTYDERGNVIYKPAALIQAFKNAIDGYTP